jgi:hypothetical protein
VALFSPWAKNRNQLKLLVIFFPLGQKTIAYSTFYGTYLFRINLFFHSRCSLYPEGEARGSHEAPTVTIMQSRGADTNPKILIEKSRKVKNYF